MNKKFTFIMFILVFCFCCSVQVFASRGQAPAVIPSIIYKDIKIVAENSSPENMGIVQAFNANNNELIWSAKVYQVIIDPDIEDDTQWVFINEMKIDGDKLIIVNEKKAVFTLDPETGKDFDEDKSTITYFVIIIGIAILTAVVLLIVFVRRKKSTVL